MLLLDLRSQLFNLDLLIYKHSIKASKYISKNGGSWIESSAQAANMFLW